MKNTDNIIYITKDQRELDLVTPLWHKLTRHHRERSGRFQALFDRMNWETRKNELLEKCANGMMLVDLAKDGKTGTLIGYCVSTINAEKRGEIESIYIEEEYRRTGIGDNFMRRALDWMAKYAVNRRVVAVAAGNEEALPFYARYNFYPRVSILEWLEPEE